MLSWAQFDQDQQWGTNTINMFDKNHSGVFYGYRIYNREQKGIFLSTRPILYLKVISKQALTALKKKMDNWNAQDKSGLLTVVKRFT